MPCQDLYRFCCKEAQGCLDSVREILADMQRGKPPAMTMLQSTPFLRQVADTLPSFVVHGKVSGMDAIKAKYTDICINAGSTLTFLMSATL